jgi:hypothetical protein
MSDPGQHVLSLDTAAHLLSAYAGVPFNDAVTIIRASARRPADHDSRAENDWHRGTDVGPMGRRPVLTDDATVDYASLITSIASAFGCRRSDAEELASRILPSATSVGPIKEAA